MKKLAIATLAILSMGAWFSDVEKQDIPDQNILSGSNPGGENGLAKWVVSTGSITAETANPGFGASSISWDAGAASETLRTADVVVPDALEGQSCLVELYYKLATGSSGDIVLRVELDDGTAITSDLDLSVSTKWVKAQMGFQCPTNDSIHIELASTANAGAILIDNAYLGRDHRLGDTTPITAWESYTPTNTQGLGTPSSIDLEYRRIGDSIEIRGYLTPGTVTGDEAQVELPESLTIGGTTIDTVASGTGHRDSNTSGKKVTVLTTAGDTYLNFSLLGDSGSAQNLTNPIAGSALSASSTRLIFTTFPIPIVEWAGSGTPQVTLDTQDWKISAYYANGTTGDPLGGTDDGTTYAAINDNQITSLTAVPGTVQPYLPCDDGEEPALGTSSCAGAEDFHWGVAFDAPKTGFVRACLRFQQFFRDTTTGLVKQNFKLRQTGTTDETIVDDNTGAVTVSSYEFTGVQHGITTSHETCWEGEVTPGMVVLRLFENTNVEAGTLERNRMEVAIGTNGSAHVSVNYVDQHFPQAVAITAADVDSPGTVPSYAVGTWTPTMEIGGTGATVINNSGEYVKIGAAVWITFEIQMTAKNGGTGAVRVLGTPFNAIDFDGDGRNTARTPCDTTRIGEPSGDSFPWTVQMRFSDNEMGFVSTDATAGGAAMDDADMITNANIKCQLMYFTDE